MTELKKLRIGKKLTQQEAAEQLGISLRSYSTYENDETKTSSIKYRFLVQELEKINSIDEEHGVLSIDDIVQVCSTILSEYGVDYCYLFGSYAKGKAQGSSDVDLLISANVTGLKYYELVERLRVGLRKKIDLLDVKQLLGNEDLLNEILKDGMKIYSRKHNTVGLSQPC